MSKKKFRFVSTFILLVISIFLLAPSIQANELDEINLKKQYQILINGGVIDPSIGYEVWSEEYIQGIEYSNQIKREMADEVHTNITTVVPAYTAMKAGDIFVTTSTSSNGLSGHTAIAISSTAILHAPSMNKSTEIISYGKWKEKYKDPGSKTWIYRFQNATIGQKAADWARKHYWSSTGGSVQNIFPTYSITSNLYSLNPTYCSKIVWQAYYYTNRNTVRIPTTGLLAPYSLQPGVLGTLWGNTKPVFVSTISNY